MSELIKGFVVSLDDDVHEDDAERVRQAILQIKRVNAVEGSVSNPDDWMNRDRIRMELGRKLVDVLYPDRKQGGPR